uniref:Heparanase n=1 Tax=Sphenodon punctatus TaxID=8508 RepID=A0A8D0HD90_SPHPU
MEKQVKGNARLFLTALVSVLLEALPAHKTKCATEWKSLKLRTLARGLSPGFLRFGGTKTDFFIFDPKRDSTLEERIFLELQENQGKLDEKNVIDVKLYLQSQWEKNLLTDFSTSWSGSRLIKDLLGVCAKLYYEEPNSFRKKSGIYIDGFQLGQDFIKLHHLLRNYRSYRKAKLYGPDVGQPRKETQKLLNSFIWLFYYVNGRIATQEDFLSPEVLDTFVVAVQEVLQIVDGTTPGKKVWLGETSSAYGGGAPRLSNTYIAGFMWLDKLGLAARLGIDVVMRQVFFGAGTYHLVDANFEPLPDYWLSLLYKKLVGTKVLHVSLQGADPKRLRVYLHCTSNQHPKYKEGDVTLFALNLYSSTKRLQLPSYLSSKYVDEYLLLPHGKENILSRSIQLNGHLLKMLDDETLPSLDEKPLSPGRTLGLPAFSYGFYVIKNAKATACI